MSTGHWFVTTVTRGQTAVYQRLVFNMPLRSSMTTNVESLQNQAQRLENKPATAICNTRRPWLSASLLFRRFSLGQGRARCDASSCCSLEANGPDRGQVIAGVTGQDIPGCEPNWTGPMRYQFLSPPVRVPCMYSMFASRNQVHQANSSDDRPLRRSIARLRTIAISISMFISPVKITGGSARRYGSAGFMAKLLLSVTDG